MEGDKSVQQMQATGARLMQSTPGLAPGMVAYSSKSKLGGGGARDDRDAMIMDLQRQLDGEKEKNRSLEDQFKYRVASFVKRETQTRNKVESLERRLNEGIDHDEHMQRMGVIEDMHKAVVGGLECVQNNTAKILQDQEKDLMRAFRARLQEVTKDLEVQRSRKGEHSTELQARHRRVVAELHEAQELAQTFDKKNQQIATENQRLRDQLNTRGDDREGLMAELVKLRKENARLKAQCKDGAGNGAAQSELGSQQVSRDLDQSLGKSKPFSQKQIDQARLQTTRNNSYEREHQYREAVTKLKRAVEAERKQVRALKQHEADMLQQRTELEGLLRQCLDDVKSEIMRHRLAHERKDARPSAALPGDGSDAMSVHELTAQDRERVLELLLSQQRVVQLLYSKTFTAPPPEPQSQEEAALPSKPSSAHKDDDFSWLGDIMPPDGS